MRQGQQNRRGRGRSRSNGGGKGQNPLTRSFESNGPDGKIRGTPAHIAEKYMSMARDAVSRGDVVMAENYYQHAEHYSRIIMTYREQTQGHQHDAGPNDRRQRNHGDAPQPMNGAAEDHGDFEDQPIRGNEPQPSVGAPADAPPPRERNNAEAREPRARSPRPRGPGRRERPQRRRDENGEATRANGANGHGGEKEKPAKPARAREQPAARLPEDDQPAFLKQPVRSRKAAPREASEGDSAAQD
ncbi:MAG: DUF4167 domain-containing protein [Pseudomonadota bacterium]